jgi:hypothetical protein
MHSPHMLASSCINDIKSRGMSMGVDSHYSRVPLHIRSIQVGSVSWRIRLGGTWNGTKFQLEIFKIIFEVSRKGGEDTT